jgi:hypothetical protein
MFINEKRFEITYQKGLVITTYTCMMIGGTESEAIEKLRKYGVVSPGESVSILSIKEV